MNLRKKIMIIAMFAVSPLSLGVMSFTDDSCRFVTQTETRLVFLANTSDACASRSGSSLRS